jgi:hypothetical protein
MDRDTGHGSGESGGTGTESKCAGKKVWLQVKEERALVGG